MAPILEGGLRVQYFFSLILLVFSFFITFSLVGICHMVWVFQKLFLHFRHWICDKIRRFSFDSAICVSSRLGSLLLLSNVIIRRFIPLLRNLYSVL